MNGDLLSWIFAVAVCVALIVFLWDSVLSVAKKQLKPRDVNTAKLFLFILSLMLLVVAVYYVGGIIQSLFISDDPV